MNPGLVVKLRPTGPWRIGPDSGARNRVDNIYHSDTLYAAVTGALARLGPLEEWLSATARNGVPAVCFSSCFPFLDEIGFIVPPRTVWPPTSPALLSARLRWKSARFVPLGMVPQILAGRALDDSQWSVDAASECLVPAGRPGPFRAGMRTNAAVDRLSGAAERHSTACIEFRAGAGLWTVVSFADEAAAAQWMDPVKTAFRLLADSGFGGERSRGWGRSESPEFIEGVLPEMILPAIAAAAPHVEEPPMEPPSVEEPPAEPSPMEEPPAQLPVEEPPSEGDPSPEEPPAHEASVLAPMAILPLSVESAEAELERISEPVPDETPAAAAPAPESPTETTTEPPAPEPVSSDTSAAAPATETTTETAAEPPAPEPLATAEPATGETSAAGAAAPALESTAGTAAEPPAVGTSGRSARWWNRLLTPNQHARNRNGTSGSRSSTSPLRIRIPNQRPRRLFPNLNQNLRRQPRRRCPGRIPRRQFWCRQRLRPNPSRCPNLACHFPTRCRQRRNRPRPQQRIRTGSFRSSPPAPPTQSIGPAAVTAWWHAEAVSIAQSAPANARSNCP